MYGEWVTLLGNEPTNDRLSVLERLPLDSAKDVVLPVARHIVSTLGISQAAGPSSFATDPEVEWCLQVVCYGLSLQLTEHDIIKDCVNIYCEWLSCLSPIPKISVPKPIIERPNYFARKMINHMYHLFSPRKGEVWPFLYREDLGQDTINRQAVFCHRVLRTLQNLMKTSEKVESETWECVLLFLISISDAILSPPTSAIGDQLCERVLSVLFEVWLLACGQSFPSPSLWKTLRDSCQSWRHRPNLFEQWNRINLILAARVLTIMYGSDYIKLEQIENDLVPEGMSNDAIVQTWFRFLHSIGNPVELTQPTIISQTQSFLQYAIASQDVVDPCQHPCLSILPSIFNQAISGISVVVDAFLGISPIKIMDLRSSANAVFESPPLPSPIPPMRRLAKSFSVAPSSGVYKGIPRTSILSLAGGRLKDSPPTQSPIPNQNIVAPASSSTSLSLETNSTPRAAPAAARPKINSILHLFGPWLFEAALVACDARIGGGELRRTSRGSVPAALPESIDIPNAITIDKYYLGRAEALGILCRIFSSKKTGEEILPAYLARFYLTIRKGLKDSRSEVLSAILSNSWNLMRVDLDGVSMLVPVLVSALEAVLPNKENLKGDLRRSAIQLLLSILPLPLHFMNLPMKEVTDRNGQGVTFLQLKPRLANILISTLQIETDSANIQMLLGGLIMFVMDTATYEETDRSSLNLGMESPTNLLSSENTSMRSVSEYSNSFDEHMMGLSDATDGQFDSAHALFVRATYLVCHRLISTWKMDLPVSLAALELLNGLARTKVYDQDPLECRRAVKWICDFIIHQCSRPPPAHSKDLHSSIVGAFQCVTVWLIEHPYLLEDKESLYTVLEVVEYGISGMKSQGKPGETLKLKDEKELKPVSLRVRDAAEGLLAVIFEQVGRYTPNNGVKTSSLVDESVLLNQLTNRTNTEISKEEIVNHFRYFVIDNSILVGLLEDPLENEQNPQPNVTAIFRCPTGRHTWNLHLRHMPRHKEKSFTSTFSNPGRPLPMNDIGVYHEIDHRYFPESADSVIQCKADKAIPTWDEISSALPGQDSYEDSRLSMILENQMQDEKKIANKILEEFDESYTNLRTECVPPPVSQTFQTARLLLSHLGLIAFQTRLDPPGIPPKLVPIDSHHPDFMSELDSLDSTSCRTCDTVHIFYVRAGQKKPEEILANVESKATSNPHFLEFLLSLGWPVSVAHHAVWTGNVNTSWKGLQETRKETSESSSPLKKEPQRPVHGESNENHGGSLYNGRTQVLYWADVTSEIAFVVPTRRSEIDMTKVVWNISGAGAGAGSFDRSRIGNTSASNDDRNPLLHSTSLESATSERLTQHRIHLENNVDDEGNRARKTQALRVCDTKIFVVWLESFEDSLSFPRNELLGYAYTGLESTAPVETSLIIFIHALRNGLFRINLAGQPLRMGLATPLIDGMVVSRRVLGNLVRHTSLNMARRKRLENDNFQPPHVRRKVKVQEIIQKFPLPMSESEFYAHFYRNSKFSSMQPEDTTQFRSPDFHGKSEKDGTRRGVKAAHVITSPITI